MICRQSRVIATLALLAGLALAAPQRGSAQTAYRGSARLYNLDAVTVVYPASDEATRAANRASAERRAAYLREVYDIDATVAADDAVDDAALESDLLVLGWNNRLIDPERAPGILSVEESKRQFLDSVPIAEGEDLLFAHTSPFHRERTLVFWSRIDSERDRFVVLPFRGSDWAVYRDFLVIGQGMFAGGRDWPPTRNEFAEYDRRALSGPLPVQARSKHFTLRALPELLQKSAAEKILETREAALARAAADLGMPGEEFRVDLTVHRDKETKEERTGVAAPSHSLPSRGLTHMTLGLARSLTPREEVHLLAAERLGPCTRTAMYDGLGAALILPEGPSGLPMYAAMLHERGALPGVDEMLDEESYRSLRRRRVGMPASALLVAWLRSVGGRDLLSRAYTHPAPDSKVLGGWMDLSPDQVDASFRSWVSTLAEGAREEIEFRSAEAEARKLRSGGDPAGAAELLVRALELRPDDPKTLYTLALALMEAGDGEAAEQRLKRLVGLDVGSADARYVIFGHYQLGRLYESLERREEALDRYRRVLELPDRHDAHRKAREAIEELSAEGADGSAQAGHETEDE